MACFKTASSLCIIFSVFYHVRAVPRVAPLQDGLNPVVETSVGAIRGVQAEDGDYNMFMGIPYAQLDNDNPFGASLPYPPFESTFDAFDDSSICPQIEEFNHTIVGTVDCLNLNVYVPSSASANNRLPVLVWIFGGGFSIGFAGRFLYGPKYLVRHDVILVTLNYRLGPYGFMCLDIPEVPGNQGLKDQVIALRWIKENIGAFGGDDSRITIAGNSAGAISVDIHLYFGPDENLFHKAIPQSGVSLMAGAVSGSNPTAPLALAEYFNHTSNNLADALSYLATVESDQLIAATSEIGVSFGPCLEKVFDGIDHYIIQLPINMDIPKVKDIDIMIGINNDEMYTVIASLPDIIFEMNDLVRTFITSSFDFDDEVELYDAMHEVVTHFYFGDENINAVLRKEITDMSSDFFVNHPTFRTVKKYIDNGVGTLYLYMFSYAGGRNFAKHRLNLEGGGAAHADELGYLFDISYMEQPLVPADELIVDRMTLMWANFVKYGNPTPEVTELVPVIWPAATREKWNYLELDTEIRVSTRPFHARMAFLDLFYKMNEQYQIGYERDDPEPSAGRSIGLSLSLLLLIALNVFLY